jgi:hypothetical protein
MAYTRVEVDDLRATTEIDDHPVLSANYCASLACVFWGQVWSTLVLLS